MKRIVLGVSSSAFAANMAAKHNAERLESDFPLASNAMKEFFYVGDGLAGAEDIPTAIALCEQLQQFFFAIAGFQLKKWNSSDSTVMSHNL